MGSLWEQGGMVAVHVAMGIGLAASAGLRAFLPLVGVGLAGRLDLLELSESFSWLESWPALVVFGAAVVAELLGDKFPFVDHLLDTVQLVVKPLAGALVMATVVEDWTPLYATVFWIAAGGSLAGFVHLAKAKLRLISTTTTGGIGNPLVSVLEDLGAVVGTLAAIAVPLLALAILGLFAVMAWRLLRRLRQGAA